MALGKASAGGTFFKPADYQDVRAMVVFPKKIRKDVPNEFGGVKSVRDLAEADIAIFKDAASVKAGEPSEFLVDSVFSNTALTGQVERWLVDGEDGLVGPPVKPSGKPYYTFGPADAEAEGVATAWYEKRTAAIADVPSFD